MKRRPGAKHSVYYLTHSMKKVGMSVGRRKCGPIAKQVMSHPRIRLFILKRVGRLIRKDMERMCSVKVSFVLRKRTPTAMKFFFFLFFFSIIIFVLTKCTMDTRIAVC